MNYYFGLGPFVYFDFILVHCFIAGFGDLCVQPRGWGVHNYLASQIYVGGFLSTYDFINMCFFILACNFMFIEMMSLYYVLSV